MGVHNSRASSSLLNLVSFQRRTTKKPSIRKIHKLINILSSSSSSPSNNYNIIDSSSSSSSSSSNSNSNPGHPNSHLNLNSIHPTPSHHLNSSILISSRSITTLSSSLSSSSSSSSNSLSIPFFDSSLSNPTHHHHHHLNHSFLIHPSDPSSPPSRPNPSSGSRSNHTHSSGQPSCSPSHKSLTHSSSPGHSQDPLPQFNGRSTSSNLSPHHQFTPLHLYPHSNTCHPHPLPHPSNSLRIPRKNLFVFCNGACGIPKKGHHPKSGQSHHKSHPNSSFASTSNQVHSTNSVQVGEDSYFLRSDSLGVADGVGGWSGKPGANPGLFSNKLMHHCSIELSRYEDVDDVHFLSYQSVDPTQILQQAFDRSLHESKLEGILGSSTALIAILRDDELRIANLGDCCCSVIRGNDFIFRSEEQQHSFNYPVQIGTNSKSTPTKDAQRYNIKVQKNDVVILSSDGLADNLFDEDILEEVLKFTTNSNEHPQQSRMEKHEGSTQKPFTAQMISESLCLKARTVVEDQQAVASPFSQRANEEGINYVGGKNDDISVLVAIVGDQNDS